MNKRHLLTLLLSLFLFLVLPAFLRNLKPPKVNIATYAACYPYEETWTTYHCEWSSNLGYQCIGSGQSETVCDDPNCTGGSDLYTQESTECDVINNGCEIDDHGARAWCTQIISSNDPDPTPPPPTPEPDSECPACCPPDECVTHHSELDSECGTSYYCCDECNQPPDWPAYGKYRGWIFHDVNQNRRFDSEDQRVPLEVLQNTKIHVDVVNNKYEYNQNAYQESLPSTYRKLQSGNCQRCYERDVYGNCTQCGDSNYITQDCNCQVFKICWFGECSGSCNSNGMFCAADWDNNYGYNTFGVHFLDGYYNSSKFNSFAYNFVIDAVGEDQDPALATDFEALVPEGWEVTFMRFSTPQGGTQTQVNDSNKISGDLRCWQCASNEFRIQTRLLAIGIAPDEPENTNPAALNAQILDINDSTDNVSQVCTAGNTGGTNSILNIQTYYYDGDDPLYREFSDTENLVKNGGFERTYKNGDPIGWTLEQQWGNTEGWGEVVNDPHTGNTALRIVNPGAGKYRAIQWVDLSPGTKYNLTATYKNSGNVDLYAHVWCSGEDKNRPESHEFTTNYSTFTTVSNTFAAPTDCSTSLSLAIFTDAFEGSTITLDSIFLREISADATVVTEPFSDIRHFQVNLENQLDTSGDYDGSKWPVRLLLNRMQHYSVAENHYKIFHGPTENEDSAPIQYDFLENYWYLAEDLTINDSSNTPVATLKASDPSLYDWNTYFYISNLYGTGRTILAYWKLELLDGYPNGQHNITSHIRDFSLAQDTRPDADDESRTHLSLNSGTLHWQRFGTLQTVDPYINVNFYEDSNMEAYAPLGAGYCISDDPLPALSLSGTGNSVDVVDDEIPDPNADTVSISDGADSVTITPSACGDTYDITLNLDPAGNYICGCTAGNYSPFTCLYTYVEPTYLDPVNNVVDFFLLEEDLGNTAWFQTVGGNLWANGRIRSFIPYNNAEGPCISTNNCQPALVSSNPYSSGAQDSPGFPIAQGAGSYISTHKDSPDTTQETLIHIDSERSQAIDGNAAGLQMPIKNRGYDYYFNKFGFDFYGNVDHEIVLNNPDNSPSGLEPNSLNVFFARGDLNISADYPWSIADGEDLVVFVEGNLIVSGPPDGQVTDVAQGGFLAFIVDGEIIIQNTVGHTPPTQDVRAAAFALPNNVNPNLEGVFIADGSITIESSGTDTRDNKFIGAGTFVGWSGINLQRDFDDGAIGLSLHNFNPTETFIHRPDLLVNMPIEMKEALHEWREVQPTRQQPD